LRVAMQQQDGRPAPTAHEVDGRVVSGDVLMSETLKHGSRYLSLSGSPQTQAVERRLGFLMDLANTAVLCSLFQTTQKQPNPPRTLEF
jgi:hypothetical protein